MTVGSMAAPARGGRRALARGGGGGGVWLDARRGLVGGKLEWLDDEPILMWWWFANGRVWMMSALLECLQKFVRTDSSWSQVGPSPTKNPAHSPMILPHQPLHIPDSYIRIFGQSVCESGLRWTHCFNDVRAAFCEGEEETREAEDVFGDEVIILSRRVR